MQKNRETTKKIVIAIGGFIILAGVILLSTFSLAFFGIFNPDLFLSKEIQLVLVWALLIIGVIDLISGIILLLW
ncbi:hypothetical protein B6U79_05005 [Candidatus Bathyarchaeota archaeon ex4484_231]|nr:MAG: hypothetical protein B6U79_05005 [Candidatus Bathyarchaeota archaeon ex4484_231]RJS76647.1 MAG: hypothetical protein CW712_01310 [Candidatus Bathyarchaeota archaeon]